MMNPQIPRRIIQTWKTHDLPLFSKAAAANAKLLNPDFEYLFFDDADVERFVCEEFPEYRSVFNRFPIPIQRYDFFRYLVVFRLGGFYLDLDVFLASGLDELCANSCVFPFEELTVHTFLRRQYEMDWEVGNYAFGASAGHPFIGAIIANCVKAQEQPRWAEELMASIPRLFRDEYAVVDTTGPGLVSRTLAEYPSAASQVKVLFPEDVCNSSAWHQFGAYGVHLQFGTWRKRRNVFRRKLAALWESRTRARLLKESVKLGPVRSLKFTAGRGEYESGTRVARYQPSA
jgi:hypothetical protein